MPIYFTDLEKEEMIVEELKKIEPFIIEMVEEVRRRFKDDGPEFIKKYCQDPHIRMCMLAMY